MSDTQWAKEYLLDPLNAPEPSQETGPGTHFGSTFANTGVSQRQPANMTPPGSARLPDSPSKNPFRNPTEASKAGSSSSNRYPSPPDSAGHSPSNAKHPFEVRGSPRERQSLDSPRAGRIPHGDKARARGNSLGTRFPGDESNKPLDIIRRESKRAHRAPHLKKKHIPGTDVVDRLDDSIPGATYHHEGPFDATLLARNTSFDSSPLAAVAATNAEALKATPRENILDAVDRHRPLEGVAVIPPGQQDRFGRTYNYKEGENLMIDRGGNYKRWPGFDYHPDDIKGKGEPQFSIDRARKEAKRRGENAHGDIEMLDTAIPTHRDDDAVVTTSSTTKPTAMTTAAETERGAFVEASGSGSRTAGASPEKKHSLGGLKRRIGSLKKRLD